ncbi:MULTISPECIES: FAD-dependent oxidoreductase [unclassified Spirosoma]|uniref:glycerol-3-phosphate dehydrogenase/oxidase n=1 Tax=unclassified Spirosoma TaxID=2621999 RepID=UPI000959B842|nr:MULTISPECIES: FAD-dependent oxidoreductase [unclassified Spirosoma]MBN8824706.1 FAD-dependent oxidoreductase [Spirosoma sp.]OJW78749.1 MAG: FAD-dependent oxidoreductase [Spirosoma sp. 48-14]
MKRTKNWERLRQETFDVCIIGAGASGAGAAFDAALRGYRVALVDRGDFASETSSRSTKLIHGGVRYLEQAIKKLDLAQLKQVRHGLAERRTVIRNAPHLAHPLAILTPVFSWFEGMYMTIGLTLYDLISGHDAFPKGKWLSRVQALEKSPKLTQKMHSAVLYYDGQFNDSRYALALAHSADEAGAVVVNYATVTDFGRQDGRITTALVKDQITGETVEVNASVFLNCTGPYSDAIRLLANPELEQRIRPSKGVHIVLPRETLDSDFAVLIPKTADGRVIFAIPFGNKVFVGTTDNDYDSLSREPLLEPDEVDYLLETVRPYLAKMPERSQIQAGFGGIRPLIVSSRADTKTLLRDHEVEYDATSGLLSLLGGKWTTYRLMAQDAIDRVGALLNKSTPSRTETAYLVGGESYRFDDWQQLQATFNLPADVCQHLMRTYGSRISQLSALIKHQPALGQKLVENQPYLQAEVVYQVREEMAMTLRDVLARRWRVELSDWQLTIQLAPIVAHIMADELGWSTSYCTEQIQAYQQLLKTFIQEAGLSTEPSEMVSA